ncbi:MAG: hypothetical protein V1848_04050 [Candidatus Magasanikbacteria bacterium]
MANTLSQEQIQYVMRMRELGVFQELTGHRIPKNKKVVVCACSDGDRHRLTVEALLDAIQLPNGGTRNFHVVGNAGGPIRGDVEHPLSVRFPGSTLSYIAEVLLGCVFKETPTIVLCPHGVCGAEKHLGRKPADTVLSMIHAKETLRMFLRTPGFMTWLLAPLQALTESQLAFASELPGIVKIPLFMEFDMGDQKIFYVSAKEWRKHHKEPPFTPTIHIPTL